MWKSHIESNQRLIRHILYYFAWNHQYLPDVFSTSPCWLSPVWILHLEERIALCPAEGFARIFISEMTNCWYHVCSTLKPYLWIYSQIHKHTFTISNKKIVNSVELTYLNCFLNTERNEYGRTQIKFLNLTFYPKIWFRIYNLSNPFQNVIFVFLRRYMKWYITYHISLIYPRKYKKCQFFLGSFCFVLF